MAIYHYSIQIIGRSQGRSAIAAAAYRSGDKLTDEKTGEVKEYRREVKPETMILAPEQTPDWVYDRQRLWNEVEKVEKRKDSQLCREINVAIPRELTHEQQRELIKGYAQEEFVNRGMIADIAIHRDDMSNPHAHIMLTMRDITEDGFGKKNREWNPEFARTEDQEWNREVNNGFVKDTEKCVDWRKAWADHANLALEKANHPDRITHLSHEAQGLETLPQKHIGHQAHDMEQKGIATEKGDYNRMVQEYNETVKELDKTVRDLQEYREQKVQREKENDQWKHYAPQEKAAVKKAANLLDKGYAKLPKIEERLESINAWENKVENKIRVLNEKERKFQGAAESFAKIDHHKNMIEQHQERIKNLKFSLRKLSENKMSKENALREIAHHEKEINKLQDHLDTPKKELGFLSREEFQAKYKEFQAEYLQKSTSLDQQKVKINDEREILSQAKIAMERAEIRKVAALYPEWRAGTYLTYQEAKAIQALNEQEGRVVPLNAIEQMKKEGLERKKGLEQHINRIGQNGDRLNKAEEWLDRLEKASEKLNRLDGSPFKALRGQEYDQTLKEVHLSQQQMMKECGVTSRADFNRQFQAQQERLFERPILENTINQMESSLNLVGNVLKGIQRAIQQMKFEQDREKWNQQAKVNIRARQDRER